MTREEAITKLKSFCHNCEKFPTCVNTDKECFKALETAIEALEQEPCDYITLRLKKGALKYSDKDYVVYKKEWLKKWWQPELELLGIQPKPKIGHCKDCKYFDEYNNWAKVDGIPLIVAHEICNKWGEGCKTKEDGYCFLFDPQERNDKE